MTDYVDPRAYALLCDYTAGYAEGEADGRAGRPSRYGHYYYLHDDDPSRVFVAAYEDGYERGRLDLASAKAERLVRQLTRRKVGVRPSRPFPR